MGFDTSCDCDECGATIDRFDKVFCEECFNGESEHMAEPEDQMAHCGCGAYVPIRMMVEKIGGMKMQEMRKEVRTAINGRPKCGNHTCQRPAHKDRRKCWQCLMANADYMRRIRAQHN